MKISRIFSWNFKTSRAHVLLSWWTSLRVTLERTEYCFFNELVQYACWHFKIIYIYPIKNLFGTNLYRRRGAPLILVIAGHQERKQESCLAALFSLVPLPISWRVSGERLPWPRHFTVKSESLYTSHLISVWIELFSCLNFVKVCGVLILIIHKALFCWTFIIMIIFAFKM